MWPLLIPLLLLLLLLILVAAYVFLAYYLTEQTEQTVQDGSTAARSTLLGYCDETIATTDEGDDIKLDCDEMLEAFECASQQPCQSWQYEDAFGCCQDSEVDWRDTALMLTQEIVASLVIGEIAEQLAFGAIKLTLKAGKFGAKAMARSLAKVGTKLAVKASVKLSTFAAKASTKMVLGPLGWALFAVDLLSIALDVWDPLKFYAFVHSYRFVWLRDQVELELEKYTREATDEDGKSLNLVHPQLFPIWLVFEDAYVAAESMWMTQMTGLAMSHFMLNYTDQYRAIYSENDDENVIAEAIAQAIIDTGSFEAAEAENYTLRDEVMYGEIIAGLSESEQERVHLYTELSAPGRCGISLSESGVTWWQNKFDWFNSPTTSAGDPAQYVIFTDRYGESTDFLRTRTVGKSVVPFISGDYEQQYKSYVMAQYRLPVKAPLMSDPTLKTSCETAQGNFWPQGFEQESRGCVYGSPFCTELFALTSVEYTLSYEDCPALSRNGDPLIMTETFDDCDLDDGQAWLEFFFGTTIVRSFIITGNNIRVALMALPGDVATLVLAGVVPFETAWEATANAADASVDAIIYAMFATYDGLVVAWSGVAHFFTDTLGDSVTDAAVATGDIFAYPAEQVGGFTVQTYASLISGLSKTPDVVEDALKGLGYAGQEIGAAFSDMGVELGDGFAEAGEAIQNGFTDFGEGIASIFT